MKNFSVTKAVSLAAGTITIVNTIFSLIPVASGAPKWLALLTDGLNPGFKFIVFFLITLISAWGVLISFVKIDQLNIRFTSKAIVVAILSSLFAWVVVFNIKVVGFSNDLYGANLFFWYPAVALFLHLAVSFFLNKELQSLGYSPENHESDWPFGNFYYPKDFRMIRASFYWLIIILGGYVLEL